MTPSLRRRLLGGLSATILAAWVATAFFSYRDARQVIGDMVDDQLRRSAELLLAVSISGGVQDGAVSLPADESDFIYQVWAADGRLLARSVAAGAPTTRPVPGFSTDTHGENRRWRLFAAVDEGSGAMAVVAARGALRDELAGSIASHIMHPVAFALPVLALLLWLSVSWGLAPLRLLAAEVGRRKPSNLRPLAIETAPREVRPLVESLNGLFDRVVASMEKERRFTADAAHELRTPLSAIKTHAQVALAAADPAAGAEAIGKVVAGTDRATRLVEQMLVLARLEADRAPLPLAPLRLDALAADCIADAAQMAADKGVDLGLSDTGGDVGFAGNAGLLAILLRNLIDNAIRYTPAGGVVDVAVGRRDGAVVLTVSDSGPGIPPEERDRALDRFHRVLGSGEDGSGLGLSIVARIAELHRAALALGDGPAGRGLRVSVTFPRA